MPMHNFWFQIICVCVTKLYCLMESYTLTCSKLIVTRKHSSYLSGKASQLKSLVIL